MQNNSLTALNMVSIGHSTNLEKLHGCTVVVFNKPCNVAYKANGGTPRTYDSGILDAGKSYFLNTQFSYIVSRSQNATIQ